MAAMAEDTGAAVEGAAPGAHAALEETTGAGEEASGQPGGEGLGRSEGGGDEGGREAGGAAGGEGCLARNGGEGDAAHGGSGGGGGVGGEEGGSGSGALLADSTPAAESIPAASAPAEDPDAYDDTELPPVFSKDGDVKSITFQTRILNRAPLLPAAALQPLRARIDANLAAAIAASPRATCRARTARLAAKPRQRVG